MQYQIGVVGLAVMGTGLALNLAEHGFSVAGYNLEPENTAAFVQAGRQAGYQVEGFDSYEALCAGLQRPRKILLMVRAGKPVDLVLEGLLPHLEAGDMVIDGGNSHYQDTERRVTLCQAKGVHFLGMGVSGGEQGARNGPALMPGGNRQAYEQVAPFLTAIAAKVGNDPCSAYIGPGGSGHFVKMVHNGIEYGDMQLICEAYYLMKQLLKMPTHEIAQQFHIWNQGELSSYLIEITAHILTVADPVTGQPLVEMIAGEAGSKGTGMWTCQEALSLGAALPTITQAVLARYLSAQADLRRSVAKVFPAQQPAFDGDKAAFLEDIRRALYASKICSYAQGFDMLQTSSQRFGWELDLGGIALLFRGGCIIRAAFLEKIAAAYQNQSALDSLLMDDYFAGKLKEYQGAWRRVVSAAMQSGIAVPAFATSLSYFDNLRDPVGPLNLLQAQRDCFGAHTFQRIDQQGVFHHQW